MPAPVCAPAVRLPARTPPCRRMHRTYAMANSRRVAKVSKQLEREISELLLHDKVLKRAVRPEVHMSSDDSEKWEMDNLGISGFVSVTSVSLSNDLQVAKVHLSIMSDSVGTSVAMRNLVGLQGYVRSRVGRTMKLRLTPEIRFDLDESFQRGTDVLGLLDRIRGDEERPLIDVGPEDMDDDDTVGEWLDEDENEDENENEDDTALLEDDSLWEDPGAATTTK
ncbi:hypothetical protein PPROV_000314100 [Pycnococcus provasolii]|uniref:Ribosome-binding factor A n=1 Tax=Pycnococcus provasolii TaxID=41880 RepID=A0A830HH46_9CHLO|nr:hypothetical protein PPROV_000314100 [Pycnococcus provasolii]